MSIVARVILTCIRIRIRGKAHNRYAVNVFVSVNIFRSRISLSFSILVSIGFVSIFIRLSISIHKSTCPGGEAFVCLLPTVYLVYILSITYLLNVVFSFSSRFSFFVSASFFSLFFRFLFLGVFYFFLLFRSLVVVLVFFFFFSSHFLLLFMF